MKLRPGESSGQADGGHAGLGSGGDETEFFHGGEALLHESGKVRLGGRRSPEGGAASGRIADGLDGGRKSVAEDHGSPGAEEVEIAVAIFVVEPGALGVGEEGGSPPTERKARTGEFTPPGNTASAFCCKR